MFYKLKQIIFSSKKGYVWAGSIVKMPINPFVINIQGKHLIVPLLWIEIYIVYKNYAKYSFMDSKNIYGLPLAKS